MRRDVLSVALTLRSGADSQARKMILGLNAYRLAVLLGCATLAIPNSAAGQQAPVEDPVFQAVFDAVNGGDSDAADRLLAPLRDAGNARAHYVTAQIYDEGLGRPADMVRAIHHYRIAAKAGLAEAQYNLANMLIHADPPVRDEAEATQWFRQAAERGLAIAQVEYGISLERGRGIMIDLTASVQWFQRAAEQGDNYGALNVGNAYATGRGVEQDFAKAAPWFRQAADANLAFAQNTLGSLYFHGQGVEQNVSEALMWWQRAADQGEPLAIDNLRMHRAKSSVGDLAEVARSDEDRLQQFVPRFGPAASIRFPAATPDGPARAFITTGDKATIQLAWSERAAIITQERDKLSQGARLIARRSVQTGITRLELKHPDGQWTVIDHWRDVDGIYRMVSVRHDRRETAAALVDQFDTAREQIMFGGPARPTL